MNETLLREYVRELLEAGIRTGARNPKSAGGQIANFLSNKYGRRLAGMTVAALMSLIVTAIQDLKFEGDRNATAAHSVVALARMGDLKRAQAHDALDRAKTGRF